ncbi:MAG: glycosyl transferase [Oscillospiraceae bacterium]|nr:glycosyl transferase [Oscillospiraceae bacterium]
MKKIAVFCIPAHGHTNPLLPVVTELVHRGDQVRFYSFEEFREKIEKTGAEFISCDRFLDELSAGEAAGLKAVSSTEMTIQDIRITINMTDFLQEEFGTFKPDVVFSDSVCFWGKLNAWKYKVPLVISTSTFAFNKMSSGYMKQSPREIVGLITGMPRVNRELKKLRKLGYRFKGLLSLVQSDNVTDNIVYTSEKFQPYRESFSDHYLFAGPSVFSDKQPEKDPGKPLVYVSMGTVINDRPDFYSKCIEALKDENVEVIISCGKAVDANSLGALPDNIKVFPYVDQLDVLSRTSVFITHCGMNSVSESLYMASSMAFYPQTNEQEAVARRAYEIGAGEYLRDDSVDGIKKTVRTLLADPKYLRAAKACSDDFKSCPGVKGAADFIETAPHLSADRRD